MAVREQNNTTPRISKESRDFFESIEKGKRLEKSSEFRFAKNFTDLKEMSTMVALTSGLSAVEAGISK